MKEQDLALAAEKQSDNLPGKKLGLVDHKTSTSLFFFSEAKEGIF